MKLTDRCLLLIAPSVSVRHNSPDPVRHHQCFSSSQSSSGPEPRPDLSLRRPDLSLCQSPSWRQPSEHCRHTNNTISAASTTGVDWKPRRELQNTNHRPPRAALQTSPARRGEHDSGAVAARRDWRGRRSAARPSRRLIYGLDMPEITNMIIMELNERALAVSVGPLGLQNTASDVKLWHRRTATRPICTQSNAKMSNTQANIIGN